MHKKLEDWKYSFRGILVDTDRHTNEHKSSILCSSIGGRVITASHHMKLFLVPTWLVIINSVTGKHIYTTTYYT